MYLFSVEGIGGYFKGLLLGDAAASATDRTGEGDATSTEDAAAAEEEARLFLDTLHSFATNYLSPRYTDAIGSFL